MPDLRTSETHDEPRIGAVIAYRRPDSPERWRIGPVYDPHSWPVGKWSKYDWRELEAPPAPPVPQPWTRSDGIKVTPVWDNGRWMPMGDFRYIATPEDARNLMKSCEELIPHMEADNE